MRLRPYQDAAATAIEREFGEKKSTLLVMPTGTGKTCVFADLIRRRQHLGRSLVLAHRAELIYQAIERLHEDVSIKGDIEMADVRADQASFFKSPVIVSTIQTQVSGRQDKRRFHRFNPSDFATVIVDEAHHAPSKSYRHVIDYYLGGDNTKLFGCTATPDRHDEQALGQVFQSCAYEYGIVDAIRDGWLVPIRQQFVTVDGLDFAACRTTAGDLNQDDLGRLMELEKNLHEVAGPVLDLCKDDKTLIFTVRVFQAERLAEILNRKKPGSAYFVSGRTPKDERDSILQHYKRGDFPYLVNCDVATEGFDVPGIKWVIQAKPTLSRAKYAQMIGRGTRILTETNIDQYETAEARQTAIKDSDKPYMTVLDFVGNSGRHKLISAANVLGGIYEDDLPELAVKHMQQQTMPADVLEELAAAAVRQKEEREQREAKRRSHVVAATTYSTKAIDPFDVLSVVPRRTWGAWGEVPASEKQIGLLEKFGVTTAKTMKKGEASELIGRLIERRQQGLCTYKQAKMLQKYGYATDDMTFADASQLITAIKGNGYRRL